MTKSLPLSVVLVMLVGATALAQRGGYRYMPFNEPANPKYDGRFMFARLKYTVGPGGYYYRGLPAWAHGEPFAEENLMKIMESISVLKPHVDEGVVVGFDDPDLFKYPVAYMTEAGFWVMNDQEAQNLRAYLLKGGFIIFDDFRSNRGNDGWGNFTRAIKRIMPEGNLVELDPSNPVFHSFFEINDPYDFLSCYDSRSGLRPEFWGMFENNDPKKRLMFVANFNNDIAQYWEWSDTGLTPIDLSNDAYKFGVNYAMYALTH